MLITHAYAYGNCFIFLSFCFGPKLDKLNATEVTVGNNCRNFNLPHNFFYQCYNLELKSFPRDLISWVALFWFPLLYPSNFTASYRRNNTKMTNRLRGTVKMVSYINYCFQSKMLQAERSAIPKDFRSLSSLIKKMQIQFRVLRKTKTANGGNGKQLSRTKTSE